MIELSMIIAAAAAFTTIGGAYLTFRRIQKDARAEREAYTVNILKEAEERDNDLRTALETKIESLKKELENLEETVNKDLEHIRETYNGEIRNLGQKIEELRQELRQQHGNLVKLLTKMIDK